jgi:hypothetical protein
MASIINASTSGVGGVITTADNSGDLNIQSGGSTKIAVTSAGVAVTGLAKASLPTGSVLQVVQASTSTSVTNSTATFSDTGLTASITPTSATSKILVLVSQSCYKTGGNANNCVDVKLLRGATDLGNLIYAFGYTGTAIIFYGTGSFQYLDSPATTSSTTYKTQFRNNAGVAAVGVQQDNLGISTITLMEIAA